MTTEKCIACDGKQGDGYHKDLEEKCSNCNGTGEAHSTPNKPKKKK